MFKNKKNIASLVSVIILFVFILPVVIFAANAYTPLITCGNSPHTDKVGTTTVIDGACTFGDFIDTVNRIINWIISIAGVIFTISAIRGGFMYMTAGENAGNKTKAREILSNTIIGFIIILVGWVVVFTVLNIFVNKDVIEGTPSIFNFMEKVN